MYAVLMRTITIKMDEALAGYLDFLAHHNECSVSETVRRLVSQSRIDRLTAQAQRSEVVIDPASAAEWEAWAARVSGGDQR